MSRLEGDFEYHTFTADLWMEEDGYLRSVWRERDAPASEEPPKLRSRRPLRIGLDWNLPDVEGLFGRSHVAGLDEDVVGEGNAVDHLGFELLCMALPGDQDGWIRRFREVRQAGKGVRLQLNLSLELEVLPWELLRAPSKWEFGTNGFFALDPGFSIVRTGSRGGSSSTGQGDLDALERVPWREEALGLLVVDAGQSPLAFPPENVKNPYKVLTRPSENAVHGLDLQGSPLVVGDLTPEALTPTALSERLRNRTAANAFHFTGHGEEASNSRPPCLLLSAVPFQGQQKVLPAHAVHADELSHQLHRTGIQLAVIAACHAGTGAWWSGFGATFLRYGIPATISMQALLEDTAGNILGEELYRNLGDGMSIDAALARTRCEMHERAPFKDWWLPLLHTDREPLRFAPTPRPPMVRDPGAIHESNVPESPWADGSWRARPGESWTPAPALSPDGKLWAYRVGDALRLESVDRPFTLDLPSPDGSGDPIAVSPIDGAVVRLLTGGLQTTDWLVRLHDDRILEVETQRVRARCGAWVGDRFVWSTKAGPVHGAGDLDVPYCSRIASATGDGFCVVVWIDDAHDLRVHRWVEGVAVRHAVRLPRDLRAVDELVIAPGAGVPDDIWMRTGAKWTRLASSSMPSEEIR